MNKRNKIISCLMILILMLALTACSEVNTKEKEGPVVYGSFFPVSNLLESVAGDKVEVRTFMPNNQDPHLWEPSPKDLRELAEGDLLVVNGANLEKWLEQVKENLPDLDILILSEYVDLITYKGAAAIGDFQYMARLNLEAGKEYKIIFGHTHENLLRLSFFKDDGQNQGELIKKGKGIMEAKGILTTQHSMVDIEDSKVYAVEMGHESGEITFKVPETGPYIFVCDRLSEQILSYMILDSNYEDIEGTEALLEGSTSNLDKVTYDPHSWLSIINAKKYVSAMEEALKDKFPQYARSFQRNRSKTLENLTKLDFEYRDKFKDIKNNKFVTVHNAWGYISRDFGLEQFPIEDLVASETPSLKAIRTSLDFAKTNNIDTIYYEYGGESKQAVALAEEIGGKAVPLMAMEYYRQGDLVDEYNYLNIMRYNLEKLYEGVEK